MRLQKRHIALFIFSLFLTVSFATPEAWARSDSSKKVQQVKKKTYKKQKSKKKRYRGLTRAEYENRYAAVVVNADTGEVLYEKNAGGTRYPASLTKMMTLYLTFDALKKGTLQMDQALPVSAKAARQPQTNISLKEGDRLPVKAAIESLVVRSANDSAMVLAEAIGGTEWNFALMMTNKAHELGMKDTVFRNPSGLPDNKQHTTAFDMARLGIALRRDFPEHYPVFKLSNFTYNGVEYPSHNRVMERYQGADGVKTGYIRASGFNLVTSAHRDGHNLVAVVMGGISAESRDNQMIALLDQTFNRLEKEPQQMAENHDVSKKNSLLGGLIDAIADTAAPPVMAAQTF